MTRGLMRAAHVLAVVLSGVSCRAVQATQEHPARREVSSAANQTSEPIFFRRGSAEIVPPNRVVLDWYVALLLQRPELGRIFIVGHICEGERPALALERAQAVRAYLIEHDVAQDRLVVEGAGVPQLRARSRTAEEIAGEQRRVELELR